MIRLVNTFIRYILFAVAGLSLASGMAVSAEITDQQSCQQETDQVINLHMSKNLSAEATDRIDAIIRDLQHFCRNGSFAAARGHLDEAAKLLK